MALTPIDETHALQIQAGTLGRTAGHSFEDSITKEINELRYPIDIGGLGKGHVFTGDPAILCLQYIGERENLKRITSATAISTGALATSEQGKRWLSINGATISRCKSDLVITLEGENQPARTIGISTKQCNNRTPTNAQLYFTTARGFSNLLQANGINVTPVAVEALRRFCGDNGFRPLDNPTLVVGRVVDPRRFFWEEIPKAGRDEWERLLSERQNDVTRLLLQKAYLNDPFVPDYVLHKTRRANSWTTTEVALYSIDELVALSRAYQGFVTKPYSVKKGSYKDPAGITHLAPRFGIIQMQRGGQQQHPDQLQFNLEAGYFYKLQ